MRKTDLNQQELQRVILDAHSSRGDLIAGTSNWAAHIARSVTAALAQPQMQHPDQSGDRLGDHGLEEHQQHSEHYRALGVRALMSGYLPVDPEDESQLPDFQKIFELSLAASSAEFIRLIRILEPLFTPFDMMHLNPILAEVERDGGGSVSHHDMQWLVRRCEHKYIEGRQASAEAGGPTP